MIIAFYFALVLAIGWYLKGPVGTGEDFFMAGREMTAWIAGLSFLSANLGSLELMGWAAAAYQYGILATHWYWIGAIPAMLFLALVMMPFYYISKTHSVPGYLKLRFGESARTLSSVSFAFMTVLMSGINMYSMALVMKVVLGWDINFSIWVSSITVAIYVALGGLRSAIFNEVLQFILIWAGALVIPVMGLIEAGGWSNLKAQIAVRASSEYTHLWSTLGTFKDNPMGIHWTGIVLGLGFVISFGYWTTDFLVVQRVLSAKDLRAAKMAPIIGAAFKMFVPFIVILPGLLALAVLPQKLVGEGGGGSVGRAQLQRGAAADAGALLRSGTAGPGHHGADRRIHVGHGGQRERVHHGVDLRHLSRADQQGRQRRALRQDGTLVHHRRRADLGGHGLPGDVVPEHHGLRAGAVQLLHRAAVWNGGSGHVVEARRRRKGGFWGLLAGTLSSIGMWAWVKVDPTALRYVALSPDARDMAENMYRALWSWIVCVIVTVVVSLLTKPKPDSELVGLVYGVTPIPHEGDVPLWERPIFWAVVVAAVFVIFNILMW